MDWIKVDKNNLPTGEVLAVTGVSYLVGYLEAEYSGSATCSSSDEFLYNVTHYAILTPPND
jgi:hypothetical protein